jgi:hypothetical protein
MVEREPTDIDRFAIHVITCEIKGSKLGKKALNNKVRRDTQAFSLQDGNYPTTTIATTEK